VSAILNDTTGCLLACAYKRPDCAMGVIIGTGQYPLYSIKKNIKMAQTLDKKLPKSL
jgi:hexokinase